MKRLSPLDLQKNELQNARIQNLAGSPSSPAAGQIWYDTVTGHLMYRGASADIDLTDRANHSGTQLAASISDFSSAARASLQSADVPMGGKTLTGIRDAVANDEPASLGQMLGMQNGTDWKDSVRAATTANITLSGTQTIDSVSVIAGDRVLVKDQSTPSQNGIYVVAAGAWARSSDAAAGKLTANAAVFVEEGTANADAQYRITTNNPITVGTTALTFAQFGAGSSYSQGAGISISGNTIAVDTASVVRKYAATVGGSTSIAVTHNLGTRDVTVSVYDVSTYEEYGCDIVHTDTNTVTLGFVTAPSASSLRCVVHG